MTRVSKKGRPGMGLGVGAAYAFLTVLTLSACEQPPTAPSTDAGADPATGDSTPTFGVVEITITGIGTAAPSAGAVFMPDLIVPRKLNNARSSGNPLSAATLAPPIDGPGEAVGNGSIQLDPVSTGSFTTGTRGAGGMRYLYATFRVRNAQSDGTAYEDARTNFTFLPVDTDGTFGATPISTLRLFDGSPIDEATATTIAEAMLPTGQVKQNTAFEIVPSGPDVLQAFLETEVDAVAIPRPSGVADVFPYGFVTRNAFSTSSRTLAASPAAGQYDGVVTFAYKLPLQPTAAEDPFSISIQAIVVDDGDTRVTQSIEEQGAGQAAFEARATDLGATVTLLPGGVYSGDAEARTICAVRTAGTAAFPIAHLVDNC